MPLIHFNEEGLKKAVESGSPVLVDIWASWCGPCRELGPTIEALAEEYEGKVIVGKLSTEEEPALARSYGVMSIPTVIFFKDGQEVGRKVGLEPIEVYRTVLDGML